MAAASIISVVAAAVAVLTVVVALVVADVAVGLAEEVEHGGEYAYETAI